MRTDKIIWLASYPKSGNTWMRAILTALFNPKKNGLDINNLIPSTIASSRQLFDEIAGVSASDLLPGEIDRLRPAIYRQNAMESEELIYHKIHDAWTRLPDGNPLIPADVTRGVIYIIRNPLDVAVSFANHLQTDIDKTIAIMNDPGYAFCDRPDRLANQLRQKLLSWSGHVKSWVDESGLPVFVMRYEDMSAQPEITFTKALNFIGLKLTSSEIRTALELCDFSQLQKQEEEKGFSERNARSQTFFRKGTVGDWQNVLTTEQVKRVVEMHGEVMERFGYNVGR
jgi:aryl sulfotransferase